MFFKEICQIGNILEESRFHESLLVLDAWHLRDFVDEIKDTRRYADDFIVHDLEQFSQKQCAFVDEIDRVGFLGLVLVNLFLEEMLHINIIVLTEQLQEPENSTQSLLIIDFRHKLKLIKWLVPKLLRDCVFLWVKVIVSVLDLVGEGSLFAAFFDLSDFDEECTDYFN